MSYEERPMLRVVSGNPSPEELAAVTALVAARAAGRTEPVSTPLRGRWSDPAARLRRPWLTGPGAWRAAGR